VGHQSKEGSRAVCHEGEPLGFYFATISLAGPLAEVRQGGYILYYPPKWYYDVASFRGGGLWRGSFEEATPSRFVAMASQSQSLSRWAYWGRRSATASL